MKISAVQSFGLAKTNMVQGRTFLGQVSRLTTSPMCDTVSFSRRETTPTVQVKIPTIDLSKYEKNAKAAVSDIKSRAGEKYSSVGFP